MIAIIDYDMGNLRSVQKGFEKVGHGAFITRSPDDIAGARSVVLPGVGAFRDCMINLRRYGLIEPLLKVVRSGTPFLGICLGFQLLFTYSEEFGRTEGLNLIKGKVLRFSPSAKVNGNVIKVPHMGWNNIKIERRSPVLSGIDDGSFLYFVHSYYVVPDDDSVVSTTTDYGGDFVSSVTRENLFACQFHPEKSQSTGLKLLKNFGDMG